MTTRQQYAGIVNQYLKSLKLDNFLFPQETNLSSAERPAINVDLSAKATATEKEDIFEVQISGTVVAMYQESQAKLFEISFCYAGLFRLQNVPEAEKEALLLVYCPSILFPFVRRIIADATSDAGFPAVMIDMIDFGSLYLKNLNNKAVKN